ncbi:hypothetical protein VZG28_03985 [Synechococcus elongatus IITB4]|uniref:hypothetical protein n=1 Tax=Synechococcus elongatus TaxID=32046 RepID=UPI000F719A14|nr:hypothetical protein DOP62_10155 [Synechococcus elongatus PCC 11801]
MTVLEELNAAAQSFVGPIFILLPNAYRNPETPHLHIDLAKIGLVRGGQYQVYQEGHQFIYTDENRYFGETLRDQRLVAASAHGTRLFIQCFDGRKLNRALIWICKRQDCPPLASSLRYKKSQKESLQDHNAWQPLTHPRDRVLPRPKLHEVRPIQGQVVSRSTSTVRLVLEPMLQLQCTLTQSPRSQTVAHGIEVNLGTFQPFAGQSQCRGTGCTLVIGKLQTQRSLSSTLESHFRVRPRNPSTPEVAYIYGAFGRALVKHRDRYWFSFDPVLTPVSPLPEA